MSYPNIPDVNPSITLEREDVINLLLASIAFEELGLSHIINSEAEKIQYVLGTLPGHTPPAQATVDDLLKVDSAVRRILQDVIKKEMLLQFKLEDVLSIPSTSSTSSTSTTTTTTFTTTTVTTTATTTETTTTGSTTTATTTETTTTGSTTTATTTETTTTETTTATTTETTTTATTTATTTETTTSATTTGSTTTVTLGSAWATGEHYDGGNNQYLVVNSGNQLLGTNLGLGNYQNPTIIGNVIIVRSGNNLTITISTNSPVLMDVVHINVESNIPPLQNAPGLFTNQYTFTPSSTFGATIDITPFSGLPISVAIHVNTLM